MLHVSYYTAGPANGKAVLMLHGFPYDIHSDVDVIPLLADAGLRVIVPYLRGHGPTRFLDPSTARSGQQAAIGADVIALLDGSTSPAPSWQATTGEAAPPESPQRSGPSAVPALCPSTVISSKTSAPPRTPSALTSRPDSGTSSTSALSAVGEVSQSTDATSPIR